MMLTAACGGETSPWELQSRGGQESAVGFLDARHGYRAGTGGLARTGDGGETWEQLGGRRFNGLCVLDRDTLWAVADGGWVVSGPERTRQRTPTKENLLDVSFATPAVGWAVGEKGTILHTRDGGATWELQDAPAKRALYGVAGVDEDRAWAVGGDGILATGDGGRTWRAQLDGAWCHAVTFVDARHGFAVGDAIYTTADGGEHWTRRTVPVTAESPADAVGGLYGVAFADADHGVAVGYEAWEKDGGGLLGGTVLKPLVLHSDDGGATWRAQLVPEAREAADGMRLGFGLLDVSYPDPGHAWAVGLMPEVVLYRYRP
jgi:photosystem II stability/assembly factor-like uncharacterized protein